MSRSAQLAFFPDVVPVTRPRKVAHPLVACLRGADRILYRQCRDYRYGFLADLGNDPASTCWMMSHSLQGWLSFAFRLETTVEEATFKEGDLWTSHFFLRRADGNIIDATGDQFNEHGADLPDVYIGPMPAIYTRWMAGNAQPLPGWATKTAHGAGEGA